MQEILKSDEESVEKFAPEPIQKSVQDSAEIEIIETNDEDKRKRNIKKAREAFERRRQTLKAEKVAQKCKQDAISKTPSQGSFDEVSDQKSVQESTQDSDEEIEI